MNTIKVVTEIIEPIAEENGFRVVDIEYIKEGKHWFLRIYIDKPGGVDLNDCAKFNELVSEQLEARLWNPVMKNGVIRFIRPEECQSIRVIKPQKAKIFNQSNMQAVEELFDSLLVEGEESGVG